MTQSSTITSVGDFLRVVKHFYPENGAAFFRGQISSKFDVSSSFFRLLTKSAGERTPDNFGYMLANKLFIEFKKNMPAYAEVNSLRDYGLNDLDLIMVSQHYGLSTRLIDWTKNPLVALYFATEDIKGEDDCSVYMMYNSDGNNEVAVASSTSFLSSLVDEQKRLHGVFELLSGLLTGKKESNISGAIHQIVNKYTSEEFVYPPLKLHPVYLAMHLPRLTMQAPNSVGSLYGELQKHVVDFIAKPSSVRIHNNVNYIIEPLPLNLRIKNQQGVFLFSNDIGSSAFVSDDFNEENSVASCAPDQLAQKNKNKGVIRIDIPNRCMKDIHNELNLYGLTRDFIYPELSSFTETMQRRTVKELVQKFSS